MHLSRKVVEQLESTIQVNNIQKLLHGNRCHCETTKAQLEALCASSNEHKLRAVRLRTSQGWLAGTSANKHSW
jgi:hypothetical protein